MAADPIVDEAKLTPFSGKKKSKDVTWSAHNTFTSPGADKEMCLFVDMPIGRKIKILRVFVYHNSGSTEWFKIFMVPKKNIAALKNAITDSNYRPGAQAAESFRDTYGGILVHTENISNVTQTSIDLAELDLELEYGDLLLALGGIENADYCETTVVGKATIPVQSLA